MNLGELGIEANMNLGELGIEVNININKMVPSYNENQIKIDTPISIQLLLLLLISSASFVLDDRK